MDNRNEFEIDHKIDPFQLDVEVARQPEIFFKWAERSVKARGLVDRAKFQLDVCEADLQMRCRKNPDKFDLPKVTEACISAAVKMHDEYLAKHVDFLNARQDSSMLDKAVMAMEMKKRMLEALITLHGQQYFAGPSTPRNLGEAWLAQKEEADKALNQRQLTVTRKRKGKRGKGGR